MELIVLGFVCFIAPWIARLAKYDTDRRAFDLVGVGGIFFLLCAAFTIGRAIVPWMEVFQQGLATIAFILGAIALLVGAVWEVIEILHVGERMVPRKEAL